MSRLFAAPSLMRAVALLALATNATRAFAQRATLASEIDRVRPLVTATYRRIHENPELGKRETKTHELLVAELRKIGYSEFVASTRVPTAVIAVLDTKRPGNVVALRAEMDGRPDSEHASHNPRSLVPGVMHSCGHDAHAAMLLGAADVLYRNRAQLTGKIVIVFQPAEEVSGGADDIVNEGILTRLGVQSMIAQHVAPKMPVGELAISPGPALAGSNNFTLTVRGKDSHAAAPFDGSDVPGALATLVRGLIDLPARRIDIANRPVILSVSYLHTGDTTAVSSLQSTGVARGTIRAFENIDPTPASDRSIKAMIDKYLQGTAPGLNVTTEFALRRGAPVTVNDQAVFDRTIPVLRAAWEGRIDTSPRREMFSEDFSYYTGVVPSLYFALGVAKDGLGNVGVHSSDFTIHPLALDYGVKFLVLTAQIATRGSVVLR
ncbi:MAG: M20 metallopeptidase family protein [Gemmatimonas sp.]